MTYAGIAIGAALAFFALQYGFWGFLLAVIFMGVGAILGRAATGKLDLRGVGEALIGRHTTSSD